MTAAEAKAKADFRNSDEFQFKKIIEAIDQFASGERMANGSYQMLFKPLKPEMIKRLEGLGYKVTAGTTKQKQQKEVDGQIIDEEVEMPTSIVDWSGSMKVVKSQTND